MVAERKLDGVVIEERLVEGGITVAQALIKELDLSATKGFGPWKRPSPNPATFPLTPEYQFEQCEIVYGNNCDPRWQLKDRDSWVVAKGRIGDHIFLVLNNHIPLAGPWQNMDVKIDVDKGRLTGLEVITTDEGGREALHLVGPLGQTSTYFEGAKTIEKVGGVSLGTCWRTTDSQDRQSLHYISKDGSSHTLLESTASFQVIDHKYQEGYLLTAVVYQNREGVAFIAWDMAHTPPLARKLFEVPQQFDPQKISCSESSGGYADVLWRVKTSEERQRAFFHNNFLIAECDSIEAFLTSDDFSRVLLVGRQGQDTLVMLNNDIIYRGPLIADCSTYTNKQLTLMSIGLFDRAANKVHLLLVTPDGHTLSEPVDLFYDPRVVSDEAIEVVVKKGDEKLTWTIRANQPPQEPQISEVPAAA